MDLDPSHPLNRLVLVYFNYPTGVNEGAAPLIAPDQHPDPYMGAGSHPDIVERVWDQLGGSLPADCRALLSGIPVLVHPGAGVVLATAFGTQYTLRIPDDAIADALAADCALENTWSDGRKTNVEELLGHGWVFGGWAEQEKAWLGQIYASLGPA